MRIRRGESSARWLPASRSVASPQVAPVPASNLPNPHDHLPDALRYLLINLGGGPEFTVFTETKPNPVAEEVGEPLQPLGQFAYRPMADEPDWTEDYEDQARRVVRTVVTAD